MSHHAWRLRATTLSVLALATLATLAACADSAPNPPPTRSSTPTVIAPARAAVTTAHVFAAYDPSGAPIAGVAAHRSGTCFTSSITVSSARAYRCIAGNHLLDPCFASSAAARTLECFADPWSTATQLTLQGTLPTAAPMTIKRPWAIELAGGRRCVAATGATPAVQGVPLGFRCGSGTAGLRSTIGQPGAQEAQALYQSPTGALQQVAVLATWTAR